MKLIFFFKYAPTFFLYVLKMDVLLCVLTEVAAILKAPPLTMPQPVHFITVISWQRQDDA